MDAFCYFYIFVPINLHFCRAKKVLLGLVTKCPPNMSMSFPFANKAIIHFISLKISFSYSYHTHIIISTYIDHYSISLFRSLLMTFALACFYFLYLLNCGMVWYGMVWYGILPCCRASLNIKNFRYSNSLQNMWHNFLSKEITDTSNNITVWLFPFLLYKSCITTV